MDKNIELRDFLVALYGDKPLPAGVTLMCRAIHPLGAMPSLTEFYSSIDALLADREQLDRWNAADGGRSMFFGVAPRNGRQGDKAHCYGLTALWADLDAKDFIPHEGDESAIRVGQGVIDKMIESFPIPPTVIVDSGAGKQLYWRFAFPYERLDRKKDTDWSRFVARIEGLLKGMQVQLLSDPSRTNFDSLLRLPTFFNPKYAHKPVATVIRSEPTPVALAWFKNFEPAAAPPLETVASKDGEWPVLAAFKDRDLYIDEHDDGEHRVHCPWKSSHTSESGDRETMLYEPSESNTWAGGFKCMHSHCAARRIRDVYQFLGIASVSVVELEELAEDLDAFPDALILPDSAYLGLGREFAELYAENFEAPRVFWYHSFLSHFGAWISKNAMMAGSLDTSPKLNSILIGTSGWTRKSTALKQTGRFFDAYYRDFYTSQFPAEDARRHAGTLLVELGSGSAEALARKWAGRYVDRPILMRLDELSSLMAKARGEGQQLLQFIASVLEHGEFSNSTLNYAVEVKDIELSLLAACTTGTFQTVFNSRELAIGMLNRMWLVPGQSDRNRIVEVPNLGDISPLVQRVGARIQSIRDTAASEPGGRLRFELTREARALWTDWYRTFRRSAGESDLLARVDSHAMGLAVLLAATMPEGAPVVRSMSTPISVQVMEAVLQMVEWQAAARTAFQPTASESGSAALEGRVRAVLGRRPGEWMVHSMVYKLSHAGRGGGGTGAFLRVVEALAKANEIEKKDDIVGPKRKRTTAYRVVA